MNVDICKIQVQLSEIEMLQSMYPSSEEFLLDNEHFAEVLAFVSTESKDDVPVPPNISFCVIVNCKHVKMVVSCSLPHDYPDKDPEVHVRSDNLNREEQRKLNEDLQIFFSQRTPNEICIFSIIQWLQDHVPNLRVNSVTTEPNVAISSNSEQNDNVIRHWIYSHHIYSKIKRKAIVEMARKFLVTGFCMPGKPGIICIEGAGENSNEFWKELKLMSWKKITCIRTESGDTDGELSRKFSTFEEISCVGKNTNHDYHMDMGEFLKFLYDHNCAYIFRDYFGMDGKIVSET